MQTVKKNCGQEGPLSAQLGRGSQDSRSKTTEKSSKAEACERMSWRKREQLCRSLINIWFYQVARGSSAFYRSWTISRGL